MADGASRVIEKLDEGFLFLQQGFLRCRKVSTDVDLVQHVPVHTDTLLQLRRHDAIPEGRVVTHSGIGEFIHEV